MAAAMAAVVMAVVWEAVAAVAEAKGVVREVAGSAEAKAEDWAVETAAADLAEVAMAAGKVVVRVGRRRWWRRRRRTAAATVVAERAVAKAVVRVEAGVVVVLAAVAGPSAERAGGGGGLRHGPVGGGGEHGGGRAGWAAVEAMVEAGPPPARQQRGGGGGGGGNGGGGRQPQIAPRPWRWVAVAAARGIKQCCLGAVACASAVGGGWRGSLRWPALSGGGEGGGGDARAAALEALHGGAHLEVTVGAMAVGEGGGSDGGGLVAQMAAAGTVPSGHRRGSVRPSRGTAAATVEVATVAAGMVEACDMPVAAMEAVRAVAATWRRIVGSAVCSRCSTRAPSAAARWAAAATVPASTRAAPSRSRTARWSCCSLFTPTSLAWRRCLKRGGLARLDAQPGGALHVGRQARALGGSGEEVTPRACHRVAVAMAVASLALTARSRTCPPRASSLAARAASRRPREAPAVMAAALSSPASRRRR